MLTLRKIRNVRADLRGSMTYGQIADLAQITDLELVVIRYSPLTCKWGRPVVGVGPGESSPACRPRLQCPRIPRRCARCARGDGVVNEDRPSLWSPHHDSDGWRKSRVTSFRGPRRRAHPCPDPECATTTDEHKEGAR